ncbi:MAG: diacylglycerol kinase family lipid kinase [Rhodospirillales bacterium]|nr:diacylglycerol kinase family lipid kinase [Rhodospirillales bacterium]
MSNSADDGVALKRRRVLIIYNPVAGYFSRRRFTRVLKHLSEFGATITVRRTEHQGDAERIAAEASSDAFDVLVAAGGDGTFNEVVNGLRDRSVPLAVLPLGTANVLAAEVNMPKRSRAIARTIVSGTLQRVSLGVANGRRFVMMAGVGFDAHLVAHVDPAAKRLFGQMVYVAELLIGMFRFPYQRYRVVVDGQAYAATSIVIANGHYYGGRFSCAPKARLDQANLEVCLFLGSGPWSVVRYGVALALGRLEQLHDFRIVRGVDVAIEGIGTEPVQCDGDVTGHLPLHVHPTGTTFQFVVGG